MYTTIEADIKNGRITGPESRTLPAMAHVLITLIPPSGKEKGVQEQRGAENSLFGSLNRFARPDRIQEESGAWYEAAGRKHDPS